jgi:hypothetical protein
MSMPLFGNDVKFSQRFLRYAGLYDGKIDGIWGPKTDEAMTQFDTMSSQIAAELGVFHPRTETNIPTLQPATACSVVSVKPGVVRSVPLD